VIDFFTSIGSSVFAAALDIYKAFYTVCHSKLFKSLIKAGVHSCIVNVVLRISIDGFGSGQYQPANMMSLASAIDGRHLQNVVYQSVNGKHYVVYA